MGKEKDAGREQMDEKIVRAIDCRNYVEAWMKEAARLPLLSPEEEVSLARSHAESKKLKNSLGIEGVDSKLEHLDDEQVQTIFCGDEARDKLIRSNLRLVISVAKGYLDRGVPLLDLIQEGNIGLMKAVDKFDPEREVRLGTFATWWIRQGISRSIQNTSRTIRIPAYQYGKMGRILAVEDGLRQELGVEVVGPELISQEVGGDAETVQRRKDQFRLPYSLEYALWNGEGEGEDANLLNAVEDERARLAFEEVDEDQYTEVVLNYLLDCLEIFVEDPVMREVLLKKWGLFDGNPWVFGDLKAMCGFSREKINKAEESFKAKIKAEENKVRRDLL